ncbi:MAG: ImmA/IrrE family metallo-endopeptidase [Acidobacteriota bacterium]
MYNPENRRSDRFLVERFCQWVPDWNRKQLSLDALGNLCDECGITLEELELDADGLALWEDAEPYIYINSQLKYSERVITGFHELTHILYHTPRPEIFRRQSNCCWNFSKQDRQAEIVGLVAWMPEAATRGLSVESLMLKFDVRRESAEFRASLNLWQ